MIRGQARTRTGMSFTANKREPRHTFRASTNSATYPKLRKVHYLRRPHTSVQTQNKTRQILLNYIF